ncbi:MAG: nuclease [Deltaproteobacteria bacterium]|nr:nuclease [Deltaproteobacteria bacterium]
MTRVVLLDSGPLSMVAHPRRHPEIKSWLQQLLRAGVDVRVPEIADYEVRRELLHLGAQRSIERLDVLKKLGYVPLSTPMMLRAADLWAEARRVGQPTADAKALDGDVILAAQALVLCEQGLDVVVATTNVGHLTRFCRASHWQQTA